MGCGASSTASTSVLEPRQIEEMRDMTPHREVANATPPQQAPLRVMRPQNSEALERRAKVMSHDIASPQASASTTTTHDAEPAAAQDLSKRSVVTDNNDAALQSVFSPRTSSSIHTSTAGREDSSLAETRSPGESRIVQPRRHSAQRRAVASRTFAQSMPVELETCGEQPTTQSASSMRVCEQRGKHPQVMSSSDGEGFLPRKLPPIRKTWITSLRDLPPIEKSSPPRQLVAGLARARDEAVQQTAAASAQESQARARAEKYARRNANIENIEEFRGSMAMFREMRKQNDAALASLATESSSAMVAIHDSVEMAHTPAELGGSIGKMSWSCGAGSLDLDLLELSTSSLSLSQELEPSSFHDASRFGVTPSMSAAAKIQ